MFGSILSAGLGLFQNILQSQYAKDKEEAELKRKKKEALYDLESQYEKTLGDWYLQTAGAEGRSTTFQPAMSGMLDRGRRRIMGGY